MKLFDASKITDQLRFSYEELLPKSTLDLFEWRNVQYFWKDHKSINKDNSHWLSEINFGLRIFQMAKQDNS